MKGVIFSLLVVSLVLTGFIPHVFAYSELFQESLNENQNLPDNLSYTRPTFGIGHQENNILVENGFTFNGQPFNVIDNHHTHFEEQKIFIGKANSFEAKSYSPESLQVQEFLFGIPQKGEAHLAELGIEVWFNDQGFIQNVKAVQNSKIIDGEHIFASQEKSKCKSSDSEKKCVSTKISVLFLEPLKNKVMAIKAIDFKNRYQITYLNDGFTTEGKSINSMKTHLIPSPLKSEGLIQVTQVEKYSKYWQSDDGRVFEKNKFGSFKQIDLEFIRFQDSGEPSTRNHSDFNYLIALEENKATSIFDSNEIISKMPASYTIDISIGERMTDEIKEKMQREEKIAEEKMWVPLQARFY